MPKREAVRCGLPFRGDGSFRPSSFVALVVEIDVDAVFRHADVDLLFLGSLDRDPVCGIACRSGLRGGFGRNDGYGVGGHPLLHTVDFPVAEFVARLVEEFVQALPLFADRTERRVRRGDRVIVMAGIADPGTLLHEPGSRYDVVATLIFNDHHTYRVSDIRKMEQLLGLYEDAVIVTTEKDAVKLTNRSRIPETVQCKLYYVPVQVSFVGDSEAEFLRQIELYVRTNQKYSVLHPE